MEKNFSREGRSIIKRLLQEKNCILATGGGAFINNKNSHINKRTIAFQFG